MLRLIDLELCRGDQILLSGISLILREGEILHITGPNGIGKTTLLRAICGFVLPERGELLWRGKPLREQGEAFLKELLYIGHLPALKGELTPVENLRPILKLYPCRSADIEGALREVGLSEQLEIPVRYLSAGQKQRVILARLLLQEATLWVLDEPLTALDNAMASWLADRFRFHLREGGMVLLTSHHPLRDLSPIRLDLTAFTVNHQHQCHGGYQYGAGGGA